MPSQYALHYSDGSRGPPLKTGDFVRYVGRNMPVRDYRGRHVGLVVGTANEQHTIYVRWYKYLAGRWVSHGTLPYHVELLMRDPHPYYSLPEINGTR